MNMHEMYVWEPSSIKRTALRAAVEASALILSINGVIALPRVRPTRVTSVNMRVSFATTTCESCTMIAVSVLRFVIRRRVLLIRTCA